MSNGKTDMRGKKITVLSEQGRQNFDSIFKKKTTKEEVKETKKPHDK